jgi:SWI/SNF-related matrix-associated actin-dependent regulator 1 of chromatin subfamily A
MDGVPQLVAWEAEVAAAQAEAEGRCTIVQATALGEAAGRGQLDARRLLQARGANPSLANSSGTTPLIAAVLSGHVGVARELAARAADLDAVHPEYTSTAFHAACRLNHPECVAALVELGCDTAIKANNGQTGKQCAAECGHAAVLDTLRVATERRRALEAERAAAAQREDVGRLIARQAFGAAAPLLARMLRDAPADAGLLAWEAEVAAAQAEAEATADANAAALLADLEAEGIGGGSAGGQSKSQKKKEKQRRRKETAAAAAATATAAAAADGVLEPGLETEPELQMAAGFDEGDSPSPSDAQPVHAQPGDRWRKKKNTKKPEPEPEREREREPELSASAQQLAALTAMPMAEWSEAQVLAWVELVELEPKTRAALRTAFEDDGTTDGDELVILTARRLQKMLQKAGLQGDPPAAANAVFALRDALLAPAVASSPRRRGFDQESDRRMQQAADVTAIAVDKALAVEAAKAEEAAAKAAPSCQICFEPYGGAVVPRMLVACGHTFCEPCLSMMLRCAARTRTQAPSRGAAPE